MTRPRVVKLRGKHDQPTVPKVNRPRVAIQVALANVPNGFDVFSNLVGIRRLKLRQLRVPLDFEENFLAGGRQDLRIRRRQRERREIEAEIFSIHWSDRVTGMSRERMYLDVDRRSSTVLLLGCCRLLVLLKVRHDVEVIGGGRRV